MNGFRSALVTGATGFIGSALVQGLLAHGTETTCLVRSSPTATTSRKIPPGARVIEVASFQPSELKSKLASISADVVFNLASYGVQQGDRDPRRLIEGNVGLLTHLLEATANWPLRRFVHAGSCSEYGFAQRENVRITETQALHPNSLYGAAKASSVLFGTALAARLNVPFVTLRLFGVFGPHEGPDRLISYLLSKLRRDEAVDLTPGEQVRDLLYEEDVAAAFRAAAEAPGVKTGEVYNVCSGRPTRVREVGEAVADALGKPRHLLHWGERQYRDDESLWLVGDNRRFAEATSWRPRVSLEEGIHRVIAARSEAGKKSERQHAF